MTISKKIRALLLAGTLCVGTNVVGMDPGAISGISWGGLAAGAALISLDKLKDRALFTAVSCSASKRLINMLLWVGADPDVKFSPLAEELQYHIDAALDRPMVHLPFWGTARQLAKQKRRREIVKRFFAYSHKKYDGVHSRDEKGRTFLHHAVECNLDGVCLLGRPNLENIRWALREGADVNARANNGDTPLHVAAKTYCSDGIAKLLIKNGANVFAKNGDGHCPSYYALAAAKRTLENFEGLEQRRRRNLAAINLECLAKRDGEEGRPFNELSRLPRELLDTVALYATTLGVSGDTGINPATGEIRTESFDRDTTRGI